MAEWVIFPVLVMGVVLGLLELIFVHSDEAGMGWFKHGMHAIPIMLVLIAVSFNIGPAFKLAGYPLEETLWVDIGIRALLGVIATIKIKSAAAIAGKAGSFGEKLWHAAIIGLLIAISPYLWPLVQPMVPQFLQF
ncbi:hypothetical protein GF374_03330 [Candidatus Woesearchaeota archaeon]|nr:hypothetical protein [Candidatus Woesearchaeota archaeon]